LTPTFAAVQLIRCLLPLFLVLAFSLGPGCAHLVGQEAGEIHCTDACCGQPEEETEDSGTGHATSCNPFQCHTCCFFQVPLQPFHAFEWHSEGVKPSLVVVYVASFLEVVICPAGPPPWV
jgi:hypothetical protein